MAKKKTTPKQAAAKKAQPKTPTVVAAYLADFVANNPHAEIVSSKTSLTIKKPWGADDVSINFPIKDHDFLKILNKLTINPRFDAIIHNATNTVEVFAGYFPETERFKPILDRSFAFHFDGIECQCKFAEPSQECLQIAQRSDHTPRHFMKEETGTGPVIDELGRRKKKVRSGTRPLPSRD